MGSLYRPFFSSAISLPVIAILILSVQFILTTSKKLTVDSPLEDDPFHHIVNLDGNGNYVLEWTVNWSSRTVLFNITARTIGYIGFGLTSKGKMLGADLILGGVDASTGNAYLYDMHVPESSARIPSLDSSQDYLLHAAWENGSHTSIKFSREFETCDPQDYRINDDMIRFIWALGRSDNLTQYHYQFRGDYQTYVLDPDYTPRAIAEAKRNGNDLSEEELGDLRIWTVTRRQVMPAVQTAYWCSINKGPSLDKKHHVIGVDLRWETETAYQHVHHVLVTRCRAPEGMDPVEFFQPFVRNQTGEMCFFFQRGDQGDNFPLQYCRDFIHAYSIGQRIFFLPSHAGLPIGEAPNEYYLVQVHYDNPNLLSNVIFDVNVDFYYTPNLREHDAGVATLGHNIPGSPSLLVPPMSLHHTIQGHCGGICTRAMLPPEGINIIGVQQHTHFVGIRHRFRHFRGDSELPWIFNDDNYENRFQPTRHPREEVNILPGDHLTTQCVYDNSWMEGRASVGGFSTRNEMCLVYIWYYNRMRNYIYCRSETDREESSYMWKHLGVRNITWSEPALEYVVTDPKELEGLTLGQIATNLVDWSEERREELQRDHRNLPQMNHCDTLEQLAMGGEGEAYLTGLPRGVREYTKEDEDGRKCGWGKNGKNGSKNWSRRDNRNGFWKDFD